MGQAFIHKRRGLVVQVPVTPEFEKQYYWIAKTVALNNPAERTHTEDISSVLYDDEVNNYTDFTVSAGDSDYNFHVTADPSGRFKLIYNDTTLHAWNYENLTEVEPNTSDLIPELTTITVKCVVNETHTITLDFLGLGGEYNTSFEPEYLVSSEDSSAYPDGRYVTDLGDVTNDMSSVSQGDVYYKSVYLITPITHTFLVPDRPGTHEYGDLNGYLYEIELPNGKTYKMAVSEESPFAELYVDDGSEYKTIASWETVIEYYDTYLIISLHSTNIQECIPELQSVKVVNHMPDDPAAEHGKVELLLTFQV